MKESNDLLDKLKSNGFKITEQRKAILQALVSNNNNLISVEKLLSESKKNYHKTNMTTIYRNLEILEKLCLVHKIINEDGTALYKLVCSVKQHHHHLICKKCGKTEAIDYCPIKDLEQILNDKNFNLTNHKLELYGYCKNCRNSENKED